MTGWLTKLPAFLERTWKNSFGRLLGYIETLPPGDRVLAYTLGTLVLVSGFWGLYSIERLFLVEVPARGGSFTEGVVGSPRFINPLLAISDTDRDLVALSFAGLMGRANDGSLVPVLAERYELSEDGKVYTFYLRENLRFSDGTPLTSEDVVFTVTKAQDPGLKSPRLSDWSGVLVESIDARTVQFTLPKEYSFFLEDATLGIIPAHLFKDVSNEEFPFSPLMTRPVGAGPFRVLSVQQNKDGVIEEYTLKAFSGYALSRPFLDEIRFRFYPNSEALSRAYESGRIESLYGIATDRAVRAPYSRVFGVFFNYNQNNVFAREEVREALSVAVDRTRVIASALSGFGTPLWGPVPPGVGVETYVEEPEDRIAAAAGILEDGGWEYDEETFLWTRDGATLSLTIKTSNVSELKAASEAIRESLEELGVPVSIEYYEPGDLAQNVIRPRRYEALLFGMVVGRDTDLYAFWHSGERTDPGLNIALYTNSSVDALLEEIRTGTREENEGKLARLNEIVSSEYPAIFTHVPDFLYTVPKHVNNIILTRISAPSDRFQGIHAWYRYTEHVWPVFAN